MSDVTNDAAAVGAALDRIAGRIDSGELGRAGRECGCPAWVIRCAHNGSRLLWIWSASIWRAHHDGQSVTEPMSFTVLAVDQADIEASRRWVYEGDNEADAIRAFEAAEAALLGREVAL